MTRVYPEGVRFSPFLLIVIEAVALPALLFVIAYLVPSPGSTQRWRIFKAVLFAIMGLLLVLLLRSLPVPFADLGNESWRLIGSQVAPVLLALVIYTAVVIKIRHSRLAENRLSQPVQKVFILLVAAVFISNIGAAASQILQQYPTNQNLSSFILPSLQDIFLPALLFIVVYLLSAKQLPVSRAFQATLYTTAAMLCFLAVNQASAYL